MMLSLWSGITYWMKRYESASARLITKTCSACLSIHFGEWRATAKLERDLVFAVDIRIAKRQKARARCVGSYHCLPQDKIHFIGQVCVVEGERMDGQAFACVGTTLW